MADNGDQGLRFERLERVVADLVEMQRIHLDEHERIWNSIEKLRDAQLELVSGVNGLVGAIRDLIDRIPPESLR